MKHLSISEKTKLLDSVSLVIGSCRECKKGKSGLPVPGEGNPDADVMFLGEAPGRSEAATGRPFIGRSGKLLRECIRQAGFAEDDVYITSPVKYLPDRGTPTKADIRHGREHLARQIEIINPKIIVLLGATACYAMTGRTIPVLTNHGSTITAEGRVYLVTIHPAAVVRFPKYRSVLVGDFTFLRDRIRGEFGV